MWLWLFIGSLLPIWRGAGHSRHDGVSLPTLLRDATRDVKVSRFGHPHLPYNEAVRQARRAYLERR